MQRQRRGFGGNALGVGKFALVMAFAAKQTGKMHGLVGNTDADAAPGHCVDELLARYREFAERQEYTKHIPDRAVRKLEAWINYGGDLSGFWWYLLSGDYGSAACNADPENLVAIGWMLRFLEQAAPDTSFGSPEKVRAYRGVTT